jgi:hef
MRENLSETMTRIGTQWKNFIILGITETGSSGRSYICKCNICGAQKNILTKHIKNNKDIKCRCQTGILNNLAGSKINNWEVISYAGNKSWLCRCVCGKEKVVKTQRLLSGDSKSCGCMKRLEFLRSYNIEDNTSELLLDKYKLINYISNYKYKPSMTDLASNLGVEYQLVVRTLKKYGIGDSVDKHPRNSHKETLLYEYITQIYDGEIHRNVTGIINGELDIYIPEKKLAIEFNGNYWHSSELKDKKYHQNKTIECAKQCIRLIHIFEYEVDTNKKKIENFIKNIICNNKEVIYARETQVSIIDRDLKRDFLNKYHLQCDSNSTINIGIFFKNEIIGVLTLGYPRNNNEYQYEIHRLCWKDGINVVGGAEKAYKFFIRKYNPTSVMTYSDISKFTGNVYLRLGFKTLYLTEPGYHWVHHYNGSVLSRTQTQKHKLLNIGYGRLGNTENEIMKNLGYYKIYNSGNIKLEWRKEQDAQNK